MVDILHCLIIMKQIFLFKELSVLLFYYSSEKFPSFGRVRGGTKRW